MGTHAGGPAVIVILPVEIDVANADQVGGQLDAAFASGAVVVIADLTATTFCDSAGIHRIVQAHDRAAASGAALRLAVYQS